MDPVIFKQILTAAAEVSKVTMDEKSGGQHAVAAGGFRAGGSHEMSKRRAAANQQPATRHKMGTRNQVTNMSSITLQHGTECNYLVK